MDRRLLRSLVPPRDRLGPDAGAGDADLLDRYAADRDERAFEELLTRYGPSVWGVCRRTLARREDAEDAFQATFVALIRLAESGKRPRNLAGWLVRVAGRIGLDSRRRAGRARRRESGSARPEADSAPAERSYDAAYAAFREEVAALPESLRVAYLVCELGGTPQPLACAQLGLKPSALTARLTRARQRLEARLVARGLAPATATVVLAGTATTLSAMPTRLVILVQTLSANPAVIPTALSILASAGVPAMMTKLKLATLAGLAAVAGTLTVGAGSRLLPGAGAQAPAALPTVSAYAPRPNSPAQPPTASPPKPDPEADDEQLAATADNRTVFRVPESLQRKFEYRYRKLPAKLAEFQKLLEDESLVGFEYVGPVPAVEGAEGLHLFKRERVRLGEIKLMPDPNEARNRRHLDARRLIATALRQAKETADAKPLTAQLIQQAEAIVNANEMTPEAFAKARSLLEVARDAYPTDATASPVGRLRRSIERALEAVEKAEAGLKSKAPPGPSVAPPSATSSSAAPFVPPPATVERVVPKTPPAPGAQAPADPSVFSAEPVPMPVVPPSGDKVLLDAAGDQRRRDLAAFETTSSEFARVVTATRPAKPAEAVSPRVTVLDLSESLSAAQAKELIQTVFAADRDLRLYVLSDSKLVLIDASPQREQDIRKLVEQVGGTPKPRDAQPVLGLPRVTYPQPQQNPVGPAVSPPLPLASPPAGKKP